MIEKVGPIKNPLTIIAIFAAIAEISGTIVLPFIDTINQSVYVWFLMVFPTLLILLFFLTLNFNHKVLYAPSDYKNEDNFFQSLPRATFTEKVQKITAELAEAIPESTTSPHSEQIGSDQAVAQPPLQAKPAISNDTLMRRGTQVTYFLTEELVLRKLAAEFGSEIQREVKLPGSDGEQYILDGIVRHKGVTTVIEVKYFLNDVSIRLVARALTRIQAAVRFLPKEQSSNIRVLFAMVSEQMDDKMKARIESRIERIRRSSPLPIDVRLFSLLDLEREFHTTS